MFAKRKNAQIERFTSLLEHLPDIYFRYQMVTDAAGNAVDFIISAINPAFSRAFGLSSGEAIGTRAQKLFDSTAFHDQTWLEQLGSAAIGRQHVECTHCLPPDNSWYAATLYSPAPGEGAAILHDITAEVRQEQSLDSLTAILRDSLQELKNSAIDYPKIAECLLTVTGAEFAAVNTYSAQETETVTRAIAGDRKLIQQAEKLAGFTITGKVWDIIPERVRNIREQRIIRFNNLHDSGSGAIPEALAEKLSRSLGVGAVYVAQIVHFKRCIGDCILFMAPGKELQNRNILELFIGQIGLMLIRERSREELQRQEAFLSTVIDHLPVGVAVNTVLPTVKASYINDSFCSIYDVSRETLLASEDAFWEAVYPDPEFRETIRNRVRNDVASGDPERMHWDDIPLKRPGEPTRYISARNTPIPGKDLMISTVWDVTDRVVLQNQLNQAQKMESIGILAGGIAHDFNNMLSVIMGYTDLALSETDNAQPLYQQLKQIYEASQRSAELTSQLLAFARQQPAQLKLLDINQVITDMLDMLRRLIGENIELSWHPGTIPGKVHMDPSQIDQILVNMCANAREAIPDVGKIEIETDVVTLTEEYCARHVECEAGDFLLLTITDTGRGMDAETRAHIFEPFFTTKTLGKGTGLGLATVFGIVKQNNGIIHVYSEPDMGTAFKIYLPLDSRSASPAEAVTETPVSLSGTERILLVDDDSMVRSLAEVLLGSLGYTVLSAASPREALKRGSDQQQPIDLLLTDVVMPEMNGRDLFTKLLEMHPGIRCLYMSGYTSNVIVHRGIVDEGVNFLQKPFTRRDIARKVREVLG